MTTTRLGPRQEPAPMQTLDLRDVLPRLSRLKCGTCRGKIELRPPTYQAGCLYCLACGREFNLVVEAFKTREPLTGEDAHPRRGRPSGKRQADHSQCAPGSWCGTCRTIRARQRAKAAS